MTELPTARYPGTPRSQRLGVAAVVAVLVIAGAGWLLWAAFLHGSPDVTSSLRSYDVTGPHSVEATLDVHLTDPSVTGTCLLRATASDHQVVGELSFPVTGQSDLTLTRTVRTERRATTVELVGCTGPGQRRPQ